jgi:hypothetical protein
MSQDADHREEARAFFLTLTRNLSPELFDGFDDLFGFRVFDDVDVATELLPCGLQVADVNVTAASDRMSDAVGVVFDVDDQASAWKGVVSTF